jgi:hypothetical protein
MVVFLDSGGRGMVLATGGTNLVAGDADPVARSGYSSPYDDVGPARLRQWRHLSGYASAPGLPDLSTCARAPAGCRGGGQPV